MTEISANFTKILIETKKKCGEIQLAYAFPKMFLSMS